MFWKSLQVTFEIFCSQGAQVGTGVFLDQTRQINWHFGYISTELIEQNTICDVYGTYWSANKRSLSKLRHGLYFYFCFLCRACRVEICFISLFKEVLPSDNSIVCFCRKAFLKSDMLAGFITSVAFQMKAARVVNPANMSDFRKAFRQKQMMRVATP